MHQVRAVLLTGYVEVAEMVGLDGRRMLRDAGFAHEALADPENRLPAAAVIRLIERSAELSSCDSFGLMMAERRTFSSLGPVSLLLERLPNLREVIRAAIAYRRHFADVIEIALEEAGETCLVRLNLLPEFWSVQANDLVNGISYKVLTGASGGNWKPLAVHSMRRMPSDLSAWRRLYAVPTEFESSFNGFSCTAASLLVPNPLADPVMARNARRLLGLVPLDSGPLQVSDRVRRSITLLLPSGRITLEQVALHMGMSARSLQRRLEEQGRSFGELLSEVRKDLAIGYLGGSDHPVTTVAALLGYGSPSSFTRWFTGAFGTTPQAWRASRNAEQSGPPPTWRR